MTQDQKFLRNLALYDATVWLAVWYTMRSPDGSLWAAIYANMAVAIANVVGMIVTAAWDQ